MPANILFEPGLPEKDKRVVSKKNSARKVEIEISKEAIELLGYYKTFLSTQKKKSAEQRVNVGDVLGKLAFLYEKIRNSVDYKSEHLLMRNAIERMLRRYYETRQKKRQKTADSLVRELIWARYIRNDWLPKSKVGKLQEILNKYFKAIDMLPMMYKGGKVGQKKQLLFGIASCEVEEALIPIVFFRIEALGWAMHSWFREKFEWQGVNLSEKEKEIQLNIAIHASLFKSDRARIRYHFLKHFYSEWEHVTEESVGENIKELLSVLTKIENDLNSDVQPRLFRFVQKQTPPFKILEEIISRNPQEAHELFKNPNLLEKRVSSICNEKYDQISTKIRTGITRSIIYIFVTKVIFVLLLEIPYEYYVIGDINFIPLQINILIPPFLMFLMGLTIRKPGNENTDRIVEKIHDFVYSTTEEEKFKFSLNSASKGSALYKFFILAYAILFLLIFGGISYLLYLINFNLLSTSAFFVFLSLVLLFGFRVKFSASELKMTREREGFVAHIMTNLTLPFLNLGIWLSSQLVRINFIMIILDFLIETPLKKIMEIVEEWTSFIRERREEAVEVPT